VSRLARGVTRGTNPVFRREIVSFGVKTSESAVDVRLALLKLDEFRAPFRELTADFSQRGLAS
jgi:hypothetical protein